MAPHPFENWNACSVRSRCDKDLGSTVPRSRFWPARNCAWQSSSGAKARPSLRMWLEAWAEFEALNALAAYGYENPDNTFPEFAPTMGLLPGAASSAIRCCPPLPASQTISNCAPANPFYIISGSNMSGKSTLLRAIGLKPCSPSPAHPYGRALFVCLDFRLLHRSLCGFLVEWKVEVPGGSRPAAPGHRIGVAQQAGIVSGGRDLRRHQFARPAHRGRSSGSHAGESRGHRSIVHP